MGTRQPHKKSRRGCNQCKARRIKCDERGPPCFGCITRDQICEYSNHALLAQKAHRDADVATSYQSSPPQSLPTPSTPTSNTSPPHTEQYFLELELMNHWTAETCLTFCHQAGQKCEAEEIRLWQRYMPMQARKNPYALDSLFAITSLHVATITDDSKVKAKYLALAIEYHSSSMKSFVEALSKITKDNCEAVYSCSRAFFVLALALPQVSTEEHTQAAVMRDRIFELLELFKGSRRILLMFQKELSQTPSYVTFAPKDMHLYRTQDPDFQHAIVDLRCLVNEDPITGGQHRAKQVALTELEACAIRLVSGVRAALVGWLVSLEEEFVSALFEQDVTATLILMHWAVLLAIPNNLWWSFKSGGSLVEELARSLPVLSDQQGKMVEWCRSRVRHGRAYFGDATT